MKLLLDTHTFLWVAGAPQNLSSAVQLACQDRNNTLLLSYASIWEMQIKLQLGKLTITSSLEQLIQIQQQVNGIQLLAITPNNIFALAKLPPYHRDPFDRLLMAQSLIEDVMIVSADRVFAQYPVRVLW
jgi:PIN domain nuclease of toxin-antitoxin system